MRIRDVADELGLEPLSEDLRVESVEFGNVVVSDLMSDVLVVEDEGFLLLTSLTSEQVIRTADIVGASAILIANGKRPTQATRTLAAQTGMPLFRTPLATFDACRVLVRFLD